MVNEAFGSISMLMLARPVLVACFVIAPTQTVLPFPRMLKVREFVLFFQLARVA
jgi:hypothetical protein